MAFPANQTAVREFDLKAQLSDCIEKLSRVADANAIIFLHLVKTCSRRWSPMLQEAFDEYLEQAKVARCNAALKRDQTAQDAHNQEFRLRLLKFCRRALHDTNGQGFEVAMEQAMQAAA